MKEGAQVKTAAVTHGGFLIWEGSSTNQTAAVAGGWIQNGRHCWRPRGNNVHRDEEFFVLGRPGSDLLFQALRLSTIGAEEFNGRVRDGIGWQLLAKPPGRRKTKKKAKRWSFIPFLPQGK